MAETTAEASSSTDDLGEAEGGGHGERGKALDDDGDVEGERHFGWRGAAEGFSGDRRRACHCGREQRRIAMRLGGRAPGVEAEVATDNMSRLYNGRNWTIQSRVDFFI